MDFRLDMRLWWVTRWSLFPGEWWGCAPVTLDVSSAVPKGRCALLNPCMLLQRPEITPSPTILSWPWPLSLRSLRQQHSLPATRHTPYFPPHFYNVFFHQILVIGLKPSLKVWITFPYSKVCIYLYLITSASLLPCQYCMNRHALWSFWGF